MSRTTQNPKTARLSVSLDEPTYRKLQAIARHDDVSVAWVIRRAVSDLVQNAEVSNDGDTVPIAAKKITRLHR